MKLSRATAIAAFLATAQAFTISNGPRYVETTMLTPITSFSFSLLVDYITRTKARDFVCLSPSNNSIIIALSTRHSNTKQNNHRKKKNGIQKNINNNMILMFSAETRDFI